MKYFTLLLVFLVTQSAFAQFTTNGDGSVYNLEELLAVSEGTLSVENGYFVFGGDVTIASSDTLRIVEADSVFFNTSVLLRIEGVIECISTEPLCFIAMDTTLGFGGLTLDESNASILENVYFLFSGGLKLLHSNAIVRNCIFYKSTGENGSGAIDLIGASPIIEHCQFLYSYNSAISSGANSSCSPTIQYNYLYHNNVENGNRPQINLGTSDGTKSIILKGNVIDGMYDETGGVSLATLAGGSISAIVDSNEIINNRYGLNLHGDVTAQVSNNYIVNNNNEDNPMQGGSGISIYYGAQGMFWNNTISGNLWGVTIIGSSVPNLGQIGDDTVNVGHNFIYDNGNTGVLYNLYNNTSNPIYAQNNYWGASTVEEAAIGIFDVADNNTLGEVFFDPIYFLNTESTITSFTFQMQDTLVEATIDQEAKTILANVPYDTDVSGVAAIFEIPSYAKVFVNELEQFSGVGFYDFVEPIVYTVVAEDSSTTDYQVEIIVDTLVVVDTVVDDTIGTRVFDELIAVKAWPNPVESEVFLSSQKRIEYVTLYNVQGVFVDSFKPRSKYCRIPFAYKAGTYLVKIKHEDGSVSMQRLLKL